MLDSIDAWLLKQPSLINVRKRCLLPAAKERQVVADSLVRYLKELGLEGRSELTEMTDTFAKLFDKTMLLTIPGVGAPHNRT